MAYPTGSSGPLSLFQYYAQSNKKPRKAIYMSFIKSDGFWANMPITTTDSFYEPYTRVIDGLPKATSAVIGDTYGTPFLQNVENKEETLYFYDDVYEYDFRMPMDKNWIQPNASQALNIETYLEGRNFLVDYNLFRNNHSIDPKQVEGIQYRLNGGATKYGTAPNMRSLGFANAALDMTAGSAASAAGFFAGMSLAFRRMGVKNGDGLICCINAQLATLLDYCMRIATPATGFTITKDTYDRTVMKYLGCKFVVLNYTAPSAGGAQITPVIPSNQDITGLNPEDPGYNATGAVYTSAYFIWAQAGKFEALQMFEPIMRHWELQPPSKQFAITFNMSTGLKQTNSRSLFQMYGLKTNGPNGD